jgi:hypothetical protein
MILKPLDWLRQAWKSLKQKIFKPVVVFLDDEDVAVREAFLKRFGIEPSSVRCCTPHMCISNLSREGNRLSQWSVRTSEIHPHFINRDCYKSALVFGESDWIGPLEATPWIDESFFRPVQVINFDGQTPIDFCMNINEEGLYNWRDASTAVEVVPRDKVKIGELK